MRTGSGSDTGCDDSSPPTVVRGEQVVEEEEEEEEEGEGEGERGACCRSNCC